MQIGGFRDMFSPENSRDGEASRELVLLPPGEMIGCDWSSSESMDNNIIFQILDRDDALRRSISKQLQTSAATQTNMSTYQQVE